MGGLIQAAQAFNLEKGVSIYTVTHFGINGLDLRSSNLANNFEGGVSLRADKSKIKSTNAYVYSEDGKLEKPMVYSDFIGRLYHQNDNVESSSFKFITEEGFSKFESKIREINIRDNVNDLYANIVPVDYNSYVFGDFNPDRIPEDSKIGDEYSINGHVLHINHGPIVDTNDGYASKLMSYTRNVSEMTGNNGLSSEGNYEYMRIVSSNLMDTISNGDVINSHLERNYSGNGIKDIVEIANDMRNKYILRNYRYNFDYFIEHIGFGQKLSVGLGNKKYGDIERIMESPFLMANFGKFGIYENSEKDRNRLTDGNEYKYTYKRQYAIGPETEEDKSIDYFAVDEHVIDFISEITKGNGGSTIDHYYREHDKGGTPYIKKDEDKDIKSFIPENSEEIGNFSKLIQKTNNLFYNLEIGSLINRFHTSNVDLDNELITSKSSYGLSRGRNLLSKRVENNGYENPYCRVWTAHHKYGKVNTLIRPFKSDGTVANAQKMYDGTNLRTESGSSTSFSNHTVLQDNGFVRIAPKHDENFYDDEKNANIKSYMFSIENLAWRDVHIEEVLSKEQRGPNNGRIMWFPPYNLKFNENINVDWNPNKFIGRGEQIYTYTNTDRSGTLSFTLLIDHPSIINKWRGTAGSVDADNEKEREDEILRFFAGCEELDGDCGNGIDISPEEEPNVVPNNPKYESKSKKVALVLFFPNNFSANKYKDDIESGIEKLSTYEGRSHNTWTEQDSDIQNSVYGNENESLYNLNYQPNSEDKELIRKMLFNNDETIEFYSFFDPNSGYTKLNTLIQNKESSDATIFGEIGKNIKIETIEVKGCASSYGNVKNNEKLCKRRRFFIEKAIDENCNTINTNDFTHEQPMIVPMNGVGRDINSREAKIACSAYAVFKIKWDENVTAQNEPLESNAIVVTGQNYSNTVSTIEKYSMRKIKSITEKTYPEYSYDNEYLYFSKIAKEKNFGEYEKIIEKIRYFNPAFHSITPEGFNARLTFLQQCTRQGPTVDISSGKHDSTSKNYVKYAGNLSFGRAPYCILRIGDFFHTKICITSISIDYDNNGGVQWDLNPEGVGVQPMYANINISFNFIGGQDIGGPVERLQNAISSNYYANASVYDKNAINYNKKTNGKK